MAQAEPVSSPWPGWRVVRKLGSGGFGEVWEIERDSYGFDERSAMKVISVPRDPSDVDSDYASGYSDDEVAKKYDALRDDVSREYRIMRDMRSCPNVVCCEDIHVRPHEDWPGYDIFIRMELLTPFVRVLRERELAPSEVARLGADISRALVECERRGVVHRDVKPQNIMVSAGGAYKLGDFGIARAMEHTTAATRAGTLAYMAPEVARGEKYGKQADVYSLGLVLYWLLNGRRMPFEPEGRAPSPQEAEEARERRMDGRPLPRPKNGNDELAAAVLIACAHDPARRFVSASALLRALEATPELAGNVAEAQTEVLAEPAPSPEDGPAQAPPAHTSPTEIPTEVIPEAAPSSVWPTDDPTEPSPTKPKPAPNVHEPTVRPSRSAKKPARPNPPKIDPDPAPTPSTDHKEPWHRKKRWLYPLLAAAAVVVALVGLALGSQKDYEEMLRSNVSVEAGSESLPEVAEYFAGDVSELADASITYYSEPGVALNANQVSDHAGSYIVKIRKNDTELETTLAVVDTTPPEVTTQDVSIVVWDASANKDSESESYEAKDFVALVKDNDEGSSFTAVLPSSCRNLSDPGNYDIEFEVADDSGNVSACTATLTIQGAYLDTETSETYGVTQSKTYKVVYEVDSSGSKNEVGRELLDNSIDRSGYNATAQDLLTDAKIAVAMAIGLGKDDEEILTLVNQYRSDAGLAELTLNYNLSVIAQVRAMEIAWSDSCSSQRPNGNEWSTVYEDLGCSTDADNLTVGEKRARGYDSDKEMCEAGASSFLGIDCSYIGIGKCTVDETTCWVIWFSSDTISL